MVVILVILLIIAVVSLGIIVFQNIRYNNDSQRISVTSTSGVQASKLKLPSTRATKPSSFTAALSSAAKRRIKSFNKYYPGKVELGLSEVSKAIKKDFGSILSRKQRKHYSKQYGIPFVVYRGD